MKIFILMANYTTSANVVISVNGKQAEMMLDKLKSRAKNLETQLAKAVQAGNKGDMKKFNRELSQTNKLIDQLSGKSRSAQDVLRRLDKATPKELNWALKQLNRELNTIERGSDAWDKQVAKIRAVKAELQRVNATLTTQQSLWSRFNNWLNNCQTAILGVAAAVTGLIMAGRKAVNAYAEMEQEMANVRKFTGMTAEQVEALNEEFKKIDTRSSRDELNRLAQEAGRLGKSSQEDVLGFVRAADKINVALDDLGDGATLTLSKLTGIFGDEKRLGTEKALLSVGSVVNELSQNCAASAPYIAEFASRMGGVGSQAGLTVQQIMAFAAVLDSNNQKLEASSTALSQVIVRIYQNPEKYAKVAGINVQRFVELVKTDMNAALIEFLSTLNKAGNMDVLSPMFKDMGENGARAIAALSTLSSHINEVKEQQIVANQAFHEATSIDKEFDVQNNTVMAGMEKARKRVAELAIDLGEKLYPIMMHIYSSSGVFLRVLNTLVSFFIKYKAEILSLAIAFAAYQIAINKVRIEKALLFAETKLLSIANQALRIVSLALISVYNLLAGNIKGATVAFRAFSKAIKANPIGLIVAGITTAIAAISSYIFKVNEAKKAEREQAEERRRKHEEFSKQISSTSELAEKYAEKEMANLKELYRLATNEAVSKEKRINAAQKLIDQYPTVFKNLSVEQIMVGEASEAYLSLAKNIIKSAQARAMWDKIAENERTLLDLQLEEDELNSQADDIENQISESVSNQQDIRNMKGSWKRVNGEKKTKGQLLREEKKKENELIKKGDEIDQLRAENRDKQEEINTKNQILAQRAEDAGFAKPEIKSNIKPDLNLGIGGNNNSGGNGNSNIKLDKFAAEKEWRAQAEASARISYATGETDFLAHTKKMDEIAVAFYEKQLLHTDISETERLQITAQWREAQAKLDETDAARYLDAENNSYNERMAELKQFYIDGEISKETYDSRVEELELEHQKKLVNIHKKGSKERLQEEEKLQNMLLNQMQRKQREREQLERSIKEKFFGDNPQEVQQKYNAEINALKAVYDREIAAAADNAAEKLRIEEAYQMALSAIRKKYGMETEDNTRSGFQKGIEKFNQWLSSEGGEAMMGAMSTVTSGMSAVFSQLSSLMQADLEIQTAAINKKYDAEIKAAEGNTYKVKKLEEKKQKEIAKAKNEANRKMFAMQVIQAVAQTATNALSAYGSAAAVPVIGYILAPIAAAMAVAAGAIQIAAIKKQQQASEAQGYAEGGFTPPGGKYEEAGVVHKGEWVASQKLVNDPKTRPLINALDFAQRNNAIGSITAEDVSRSITAPVLMATRSSAHPTVINNNYAPDHSEDNKQLASTIRQLNKRLNEPFVTVNTVTGDFGIKNAQDEYNRLMSNKDRKKYN